MVCFDTVSLKWGLRKRIALIVGPICSDCAQSVVRVDDGDHVVMIWSKFCDTGVGPSETGLRKRIAVIVGPICRCFPTRLFLHFLFRQLHWTAAQLFVENYSMVPEQL